MKKYIVILLCVLISCCKREPSVGMHQGDNAAVSPSKTKGIDGYVGNWHYMVWINDSAYQNKSFCLELRKTGKIYVKGIYVQDAEITKNADKNIKNIPGFNTTLKLDRDRNCIQSNSELKSVTSKIISGTFKILTI